MNKIKKIVLILLVMSLIVNPMYLTLRVHAANEELAMSRISDTLQSVMRNGTHEKIDVMIWIEDINSLSANLYSSEIALTQAKATISHRRLCEISATDSEIYSQYMSARKEELRNHYEIYIQSFVDEYLQNDEVLFLSRYTPTIIVSVTQNRILELASIDSIFFIDFYDDAVNKDEYNSSSNSRALIVGDDYYYTVNEIMRGYGINDLKEYVDSDGEGINIGVLDSRYPDLDYPLFGNNIVQHYYDNTVNKIYTEEHPTHILEILYTILPEANYFYTTYWNTVDVAGVRTTLAEEIEWFIDNNVDLISCSLNLYSVPNDGSNTDIDYDDDLNQYGAIARYLDQIITNYGVTFIIAAGNVDARGIASGGMSYNAITVGNYNVSQGSIASSSSYYNGTEWAYKPDICAPGFVYFDNTTDICDYGTSYATPIIAGIAALIMIENDYMLLSYDIKSILCAGASQRLYSIDDPNYRIYGAGVIHGTNVASILQNNTYAYDYFNPNEEVHSFTVTLDDGVCPTFALSFEHRHTGSNDYIMGNLDLFLYDSNGNLVASSQTTQNNVEIIRLEEEYPGVYTLIVEQIAPPEENGSDTYVCYSVAWYIDEYE